MTTLQHYLRTRATRRTERGLATLDVLLGVAIFALIVVIGVQNFNTFRGRAYVTQASSDVKQTASAIEAVHAKDDKYPDTVTASASTLTGVNLTRGSRIAGYAVTGNNFRACVLSGPRPNQPVAYAIYDSARGTVVEAGKGATNAACDGTGIDTTTDPSDPAAARVTNVRADVAAGEKDVALSWDPLVDAGNYQVYLDGASTPAWTGPGTTTTLPSMSDGPHQVTVTATIDGETTDPSDPAVFTIYGDNDFVRFAHPVDVAGAGATFTSRDYTNQTATTESGESASLSARGMWWTYDAVASGTVRVSILAASDGTGPYPYPSIYVWKSTSTNITEVQTGQQWGAYRISAMTFAAEEGETYKIRLASTYNDVGRYRLQVQTGPTNDNLTGAISITGVGSNDTWTSPDQSNALAGNEANEDATSATRSMWWSYEAAVSGMVRVSVIAASDGTGPYPYPSIYVWKSTSNNIVEMQTATKMGGNRINAFNFNAVRGETYKVKIASTYNDIGHFRARLQTSPPNDNVAEATAVGTLLAGQSWTSTDTDTNLAGNEPGESVSLAGRGTWWSFTAATSGNVRLSVLNASDGTPRMPRPGIAVWQSPSTVVTEVQASTTTFGGYGQAVITFPVVGGRIYKIRVADTYGDPGKYRLQAEAL